jgi:hypothetical protein
MTYFAKVENTGGYRFSVEGYEFEVVNPGGGWIVNDTHEEREALGSAALNLYAAMIPTRAQAVVIATNAVKAREAAVERAIQTIPDGTKVTIQTTRGGFGGKVYTGTLTRTVDRRGTIVILDGGMGVNATRLAEIHVAERAEPLDADGQPLVPGKAYRVRTRGGQIGTDHETSRSDLLVFAYVYVEDDNSRTFVWHDGEKHVGWSEDKVRSIEPVYVSGPSPEPTNCPAGDMIPESELRVMDGNR